MNFFRKKDPSAGGRLTPPPPSPDAGMDNEPISARRPGSMTRPQSGASPNRTFMLSPRLRNRPKLHVDELRSSMHQLRPVPKKEKKSRFDFIKGLTKQRSNPNVVEEDTSASASAPSSPKNKLRVPQSPFQIPQNPMKRFNPPPLPLSTSPLRDKNQGESAGGPASGPAKGDSSGNRNSRQDPSRGRHRPSLNKEVADELRMSFTNRTNRNAQKDEKRQDLIKRIKEKREQFGFQIPQQVPEEEGSESNNTEKDEPTSQPPLSRKMLNPLKMFQRKKAGSFDDPSGKRSKENTPSSSIPPRRVIDKKMADELRTSVHAKNLLDDEDDFESIRPIPRPPPPSTARHRPSLNTDVANELRMSFRKRDEKKADKRQQLVQRIQERRSKRNLGDIQEVNTNLVGKDVSAGRGGRAQERSFNDTRNDPRQPSKTGPPTHTQQREVNTHATERKNMTVRREMPTQLRDELRASIHSRTGKKDNKRQEIAARIMKRRESQRHMSDTTRSDPKRDSKHSVSFSMSNHSMDSSFASFEDDTEPRDVRTKPTGTSRDSNPAGYQQHGSARDNDVSSGTATGEPENRYQRVPPENRIHPEEPLPPPREDISEIEGDFNAYKYEWARLIKEKKKLQELLVNCKLETSELSKDVETYKSENERIKDRFFEAQETVERLTRQQTEERKHFDNSTDLIAESRMDLAKALNDYRILQTQLSDYQYNLASKDRRIEALNDALDSQTDRADDFFSKLGSAEHELHYQTEEKRRIEEELQVVLAAKEGKDMKKVFRQLEEERSHWLGERAQELEIKRQELDKENQRIVTQEREKQRQAGEEMKQLRQKQRSREEELHRLQDGVNKQLQGFQEENRAVKEKLNKERLDSSVGLKKKDHSISLLEQEIATLKKSLAAHRPAERDIEKHVAAAESARVDLEDALKHKTVLEKELRRIQRSMEKLKETANEWQEIVVPGHRGLRGVTFGNHSSDSLAGFLTILVEEQSAFVKKRDSKSSKLAKYVKERDSRKKSKKKKGKDDKTKKTSKKKSKDKKSKKKSKTKDKHDKGEPSESEGLYGAVARHQTVVDDDDDRGYKKAKKRERKARDKVRKEKKKESDKKKFSKAKDKAGRSDDNSSMNEDDVEDDESKKAKKSKKKKSKKDSKKSKKDSKKSKEDRGKSDKKKKKKSKKDKSKEKSGKSSSSKTPKKEKSSGGGYPSTVKVKSSSKHDKKKSRGSDHRIRSSHAVLLQ
jgi:hypothetical protein